MKIEILSHTRSHFWILIFTLVFTLCIETRDCSAQKSADFVFTNGKVYTVNDNQPWAEAVAVTGDKIAYVGKSEVAKEYIGPETKIVDLKGQMMMPGFVEAHIHTTVGAAFAQGLWLADFDTKEETLAAIKKYVHDHPEKKVIMGFGWKPYAFPNTGPTKDELDAITNDKPIFLIEISAHSAWVNSKALEMAGVSKKTKDPQPGFSYFRRDEKGEATGLLVEAPAEMFVLNKIQPITPDYVRQGLEELIPKLSAAGITTVMEMGYIFQGPATVQKLGYDLLTELEEKGALTTRVYSSYYVNNPKVNNFEEYEKHKALSPDTPLVKHRILKINNDGDPATHSVKLYEPYLDTGKCGNSIFKPEALKELVTKAAANDVHVHFHAMGDATVGDVLAVIEAAQKAYPKTKSRFSLAHTYLVSPRDFERIQSTGMIPVFAGSFMTADPSNLDVRSRMLGPERDASWFPIRSLTDRGLRCAVGSDFPASGAISTYKSMDQLQYVVTRKALSGKGDIFPLESERLTLKEGIQAATLNGAHIIGLEDEIGSIEKGKKADLIILDQNLFGIDVSQIHKTKTLMTMMDGKIVYEAPASR